MKKDNTNLKRMEVLGLLKNIDTIILDPLATLDMGIECTIATKKGLVYSTPGMFLFCGGWWPVTIEQNNKNESIYHLQTNEKNILNLSTVKDLDKFFSDFFNIDSTWESFSTEELVEWYEKILNNGYSIVEMTKNIE